MSLQTYQSLLWHSPWLIDLPFYSCSWYLHHTKILTSIWAMNWDFLEFVIKHDLSWPQCIWVLLWVGKVLITLNIRSYHGLAWFESFGIVANILNQIHLSFETYFFAVFGILFHSWYRILSQVGDILIIFGIGFHNGLVRFSSIGIGFLDSNNALSPNVDSHQINMHIPKNNEWDVKLM